MEQSRVAGTQNSTLPEISDKKSQKMAATGKAGSLSTWQKFYSAFRVWYVNAAGYRQMGLRADDLHMEENQDVSKAISRLPEEVQYQRIFRIKRALDLSMKHQILPKEDWTDPKEDVFYLSPLIEQAKAERIEREQWDRI
ncbi:cytochrome b-c1 complex subunit 7-like [Hydractinia symbiolongicarpus]|uniref:cytochrome b-c1 complex subunit 7-like n=1 Tax=Hydractinia symbiolongicarpus TaxID=13093 RepID=UPI00254AEB5A|nr:cytochrome b-c1 complex subunit 7-like [Hydractinia symbiolongicarpus]